MVEQCLFQFPPKIAVYTSMTIIAIIACVVDSSLHMCVIYNDRHVQLLPGNVAI